MVSHGPASGASYDFDVTQRVHEYRIPKLNQQDLDRNMCLPTSSLFKWMQAARMELPWMQAGYRGLSDVEPRMARRMLVASQGIRLARPDALAGAADKDFVTRVEIGEIGRTSLEFVYTMFLGGECIAHGSTVMIVTSGTPGSFKPSPVPEDLKALAAPRDGAMTQSPSESKGKLADQLLAGLSKVPPVVGTYTTSAKVRFSDEDVNWHANHSTMARFFEDAKAGIACDACDVRPEESFAQAIRSLAQLHLEGIAIAYVAEAHAQDELDILLAASELPGPGRALDVWVRRLRPNPCLVARGRLFCGGEHLPGHRSTGETGGSPRSRL